MSAGRFILALLALLFATETAQGQRLVFRTSDPTISIHSNFAGETITLFGNIEPSLDGTPPQGHFDIVMAVRGPVEDRVVRRKDRQFGVMLNAEQALFTRLPSFYQFLSTRPLDMILDPDILAERGLTPRAQAAAALSETDGDPDEFTAELLRLMTNAGFYRTDERGIALLSRTFFSTRITLPANVPNGNFLAHTFVVQNGEIVAEGTQRFFVRKSGFERFVGEAAVGQPLLYGLATVLLALFTGWMGGVLFRR